MTTAAMHTEPEVSAFSWVDYTLFVCILGTSVVVGIYFALFSKQDSTNEYLFGGKSMKVLPIAMSLIASQISGITILTLPVEVYKFGDNYIWYLLAVLIICIITYYVYLPVFFKFQFTSIYQYLQLRFDKKICTLASFMFVLSQILLIPVVIYLPALSIAQVTGVNLHFTVPVICVVCIFYTTIGGIRSVVWTDVVQLFSMLGSAIAFFFIGVFDVGGFSVVWEKSAQSQRFDIFDFSIDPTKQDGFWAYGIAGTIVVACAVTFNQGIIQKLLSVPTLQKARNVLVLYFLGMIAFIGVFVFTGNIIYGKYSDCDPITSKQISRSDQLFPFFAVQVAGNTPGLSGIFIAGIVSASLSTLSAGLNALSGTIYKDFISPVISKDTTEKTISNLMKVIVVVVGAICTGLVFVIEKMDSMFSFVVGIHSIVGGPLLGLFSLGMLFPQVNSIGALCGGIAGLLFSSWKEVGSQYYRYVGAIKNPLKPLSVDGCPSHLNFTITENLLSLEPFILYRISSWYTPVLSAAIVIVTGLVFSRFTKKNQTPINLKLISPVAHCFFTPKSNNSSN